MGQVQFQTSLKEIFKAHTFSQINMFLCFVSNSFTFSLVMVLQVVVVGCDGIFVDMLLFYIVLVLLFWMSFLVFCVLIFWLMFLLVWELFLLFTLKGDYIFHEKVVLLKNYNPSREKSLLSGR